MDQKIGYQPKSVCAQVLLITTSNCVHEELNLSKDVALCSFLVWVWGTLVYQYCSLFELSESHRLFVATFHGVGFYIQELERKFSKYGRVREARVVRDNMTGESRGFGFVIMSAEDEVDEVGFQIKMGCSAENGQIPCHAIHVFRWSNKQLLFVGILARTHVHFFVYGFE